MAILRVSLRSKLSVAFLGVTLCCGVIASAIVDFNVQRTTRAQFADRLAYETTMLGQMTASALFGEIDPNDTSLNEPVAALAVAVHTQLSVIAKNGAVVADSSASNPRDVPNQANEVEMAGARTGGSATSIRNGRMYVAMSILRDGAVLGFARCSVPMTEVTAQVEVVRKRMMLGTAAASLLAVLLGLVFASGIVRPVRALADGARRVGGGDFAHTIPAGNNDELGDLATSFNEMTRDLRYAVERLDARNRDMRLVLDNVNQGLLTLDRAGRISVERSAVVTRWFGQTTEETTFWDYIARGDPGAASTFRMNWNALIEDIMPMELSLDQLPNSMVRASRHYALGYTPLQKRGAFEGMLVVITDVTERLIAERAEAEQREIVNAFERIMRDKNGFLEFFDDADRLIAALCDDERPSLVEAKRWLHTLKGNAGLFSLSALATFCHELEGAIEETGGDLTPRQREALRIHWDTFARRLGTLLGDGNARALEIDDVEYEGLLRSLVEGKERGEIARMVTEWKLELVSDRLLRFASMSRDLAVRLGKTAPDVKVEAGRLRLPREVLGPFWGAFVHVVRNAVDHGLESPAERERAGKPPAGTLRLRAVQVGDNVHIEVSDDGRGIDWTAVAAKAYAAGRPCDEPSDLVEALYRDGLSTRGAATLTSGRGVGLGAARAECDKLGGSVTVESVVGVGTTVRFALPRSVVVPPPYAVRFKTVPAPAIAAAGRERSALRS